MQWDLLLLRLKHQHYWFLCLWPHAPFLDLHALLPASEMPSQGQGCCCLLSESVALSHRQSSLTHLGAHSTPMAFCTCPDDIISLAYGYLPWRPGMSYCNLCGSGSGQKKTQFFFSCVYCEGRNDKENKTEDGWSFLFHPFWSFFSLTLPCLLDAPHKDGFPISKKLYPLSKQVHKSKYLDGAVKSSIIENTEA